MHLLYEDGDSESTTSDINGSVIPKLHDKVIVLGRKTWVKSYVPDMKGTKLMYITLDRFI